jgi:alkylation response protein AidB-like acyl-CoA dehydrogenase
MLVKTAPDRGAHGCSFFLVPTNLPGFHVAKKLKKIGNKSSDTAELFLEDVRVPKRYLLGEENMGFMYLMQNFQTERLIAAVGAISGCFLTLDSRHRLRPRARGLRQADHQARGVAAQVRGPLHEAPRPREGLRLQVRRHLQRRALREEGAPLDGDGEAHLAWRRSWWATCSAR